MLACIYKEPYKLEYREIDKPSPQIGEILIKIKYAGICGSDIHHYKGIHPRGKSGIVLCHEFSGIIEDIAPNTITSLSKGDHVMVDPSILCMECEPCKGGNYNVCDKFGVYGTDKNGGITEYICIPASNVHKVNKSIDLKTVALIEPLTIAVHAVKRSKVGIGKNVLIVGGGAIGFLVASVCQVAGASYVCVSEVNSYRLTKLKEAGFNTINPMETDLKETMMKETSRKGIDIVFDTAGATSALKGVTSVVNPKGQIVIVAMNNTEPPFDLLSVMFKELDVTGSHGYLPSDFAVAIELLEQKKVSINSLITQIYSLNEAEEAFKLAVKNDKSMKILIEVN